MAFFTVPRQELAWLISLNIGAVPLVLSLDALLNERQVVDVLASDDFQGCGGNRFVFGGQVTQVT